MHLLLPRGVRLRRGGHTLAWQRSWPCRASDEQNLALGQLLLERNVSTGNFTLRLGVKRSVDLLTWTPLTGFTPTYDVTTGEIFLEFTPGASGAEFYLVFRSRP